MEIETIDIGELHEDPANVRVHPERNIAAIKASLARFGQVKPVVIDAQNVVRAGNGTLRAARELGWLHVKCVRTKLIGSEATAYALTDNRTAETSEWDYEGVSAMLKSMQAEGVDITTLGWEAGELEKVLARDNDFGDIAEVSPPELASCNRAPFQKMTFVLHDTQAEIVRTAIKKAISAGAASDVNGNSNGNALALVCEKYLGK